MKLFPCKRKGVGHFVFERKTFRPKWRKTEVIVQKRLLKGEKKSLSAVNQRCLFPKINKLKLQKKRKTTKAGSEKEGGEGHKMKTSLFFYDSHFY